MQLRNVRLASLAHELPTEAVTSAALEERLGPLYERLGLRVGRLELMTGIAERRRFAPGTLPSAISAAAGRQALQLAFERAAISPESLGLLVHSSVCRDFLEPATASVVHANLGLPKSCAAFDLSNACLGFVNSIRVAGAMIDSGQIEAALVTAGENGAPLVDATVADLLARDVDRAELKRAFASLTIGSGGAAAVLVHERLAPEAPRILGGATLAATEHVGLCQGDLQHGAGGPLMQTDSEALLHAGCTLAAETYPHFLQAVGWGAEDIDRVITHQVGVAHRRALLGALKIDASLDFPTVEFLGNVGSVSLPATLSLALDAGRVTAPHRVALLGIGSGLHCSMLGLDFGPERA